MMCHGVRAKRGKGGKCSKPLLDVENNLFFNWIYGTRG
jgi:hypothetical protein